MTQFSIIEFKRPLILVTASPARRALVEATGLKVAMNQVEIDETPKENEKVDEYVKRVSIEKSNAFKYPFKDAVVITVDTAIELNGEIIGKPRDEKHARETLQKLSNKTHDVVSAISVRDVGTNGIKTEVTLTKVQFEDLTPQIINWYISTLEWKKRAGAYAIQGKGAALIKSVDGCYTNVIGISIPTLIRILKEIG